MKEKEETFIQISFGNNLRFIYLFIYFLIEKCLNRSNKKESLRILNLKKRRLRRNF